MTATSPGPLTGIRVVEIAGLGAAPFAAMLLSDLGADVLRVDRPGAPDRPADLLARGRASIVADLKDATGLGRVREAAILADVLIEGFRPGVMERLGLGPQDLMRLNPRLVYARVTGWGQAGPLAQRAGHDINYIALSGMLSAMGPADRPPMPPLNLVGDFGGGGAYAALGVVAALYERTRSGLGQVVDAAMVDGAASMTAMLLSHIQGGRAGTGTGRGRYFLDGSAPYYRCYRCRDGEYLAVGAIEPQFWQEFCRCLGSEVELSQRYADWGRTSALIAELIARRERHEWLEVFEGTDACVTPVLDPDDILTDEHLRARQTYIQRHGLKQPNVAPRLSRTGGAIAGPPSTPGKGGDEMLARWREMNP